MRAHHLIVSLSLLTAGAIAAPARAQAPAVAAAPEPAPLRHTLLVSARVGGLFPVNGLGPGPAFELGVGYAPPLLRGRLALLVGLGYSQHGHDATLTDPRLDAGSEYRASLTQRDLGLFCGPQVFILDPRGRLVPYAAAGVDVHFLESRVSGDAGGVPLGDNRETSTAVGLALRAGVGWRLGPGLLVGELAGSWAPVTQDVTGASSRGGISLLVGYTLALGLGR